MELNELRLDACPYREIGKHTPVLNHDEIPYHLFVMLNPEMTRDCTMYEVHELDKEDSPIIFPDTFMRVSPTWIRVITDHLNKKVGQHIYRMAFVDKITTDTFFLYFSYIIQDDNPNKPYIYMNREKPNNDLEE